MVDISNPTGPVIVDTLDTPGYAGAIAVAGGYVYVADDWAGVHVIDVSGPVALPVGTVDTHDLARGIAVLGPYAYVADYGAGLTVIPAQCTSTGVPGAGGSSGLTTSSLRPSPNPFRGSTTLRFSAPQPGRAVVRIYDTSGRLVATPLERIVPSGPQEVLWTAESARGARLGSGIYFAELEMGGERTTARMTLLR